MTEQSPAEQDLENPTQMMTEDEMKKQAISLYKTIGYFLVKTKAPKKLEPVKQECLEFIKSVILQLQQG